MRIDEKLHTGSDWRVHALLGDFALEDVWQFPIVDRGEPIAAFARFRRVFPEAMERLIQSGPAGLLFRFRGWLGRVLKWDTSASAGRPLHEDSLRARYLDAEGKPKDGETLDGGTFHEVYVLPRESLAETANKTVHAAIHLSWPELEDGTHTARMAVYVKATGPLTRVYMALITPFRLWIVYPALMRMGARVWNEGEDARDSP